MFRIRTIFSILTLILLSGCATIVKDDSQPVAFSSDPQGASVEINDVPSGITPETIMVKRTRGKQMVTYALDGYHAVTFPLDKSLAGMTFGNIIFGGLVGVGVDAWTGKCSNYEDSVHIVMTPLTEPKPVVDFDSKK